MMLTPTLFDPKPVANLTSDAAQREVPEGCTGDPAAEIAFDHSASFHPDPARNIVDFRYDFDASDGVDFDNPDAQVAQQNQLVRYTYPRAGTYMVTLQTTDNDEPDAQVDTASLQVVVVPGVNVPPSAAHGGAYVANDGEGVQLNGSGSDDNANCGDVVTYAWDLTNNGQFNDANGAAPMVPAATFAGLPRDVANPIHLRATDSSGEVRVVSTTLTIFDVQPVAAFDFGSNPAACPSQVALDASNSEANGQGRVITNWDWEWSGDGQFDDASGEIVNFPATAFETVTVALRVTDNAGNTDTTTMDLVVNLGNVAPTAGHGGAYQTDQGDDFQLAGTAGDPNAACGDSIVSAVWTVGGQQFNGLAPIIPAAVIDALNVADPNTGLPTNAISLTVTDEFGVQTTVDTTLTVYGDDLIAEFDADPDPAPINVATGDSSTTLDGSRTRLANPNRVIATFQWDYDNDGSFDAVGEVAVWTVNFDPVPVVDVVRAVRLVVTDDNGVSDETVKNVTFDPPPTPPNADADPTDAPEQNYQVLSDANLVIDASDSSDPDEGEPFNDFIAEVALDCDSDGDYDVVRDRAAAADPLDFVFTLTPQEQDDCGMQVGGFENVITVRVTDSLGARNTDTAFVRRFGADPIAVANADAVQVACDQDITFSCADSTHSDLVNNPAIVNCEWDWENDGVFDAAGDLATDVAHNFNAFGDFTVLLRVTDENGRTDEATLAIAADQGNNPPTAGIVSPATAIIGSGYELDAGASTDGDPGCGDTMAYNISYTDKDGNAVSIDSDEALIPLSAAQVGALLAQATDPTTNQPTALVTLTVTDRFGAQAQAQGRVRVYNDALIADPAGSTRTWVRKTTTPMASATPVIRAPTICGTTPTTTAYAPRWTTAPARSTPISSTPMAMAGVTHASIRARTSMAAPSSVSESRSATAPRSSRAPSSATSSTSATTPS